jgi:hypothetical protein
MQLTKRRRNDAYIGQLGIGNAKPSPRWKKKRCCYENVGFNMLEQLK